MASEGVEDLGRVDGVDARRGQILRSALEVIAERGFSETRIADVAARAEVSPGLVIYYFKTKDQLLTEAMRFAEDAWYEEGSRRTASIESAAGRLEAIVAATFDSGSNGPGTAGSLESWELWLDMWALAVRNPDVGQVRREFDEHWRSTIRQIVLDGLERGEFSAVEVDAFAVTFSALLDGFAVQVALRDPMVSDGDAFDLSMRFAADQLGFEWRPTSRRRGGRGKSGGKPAAVGKRSGRRG